MWVKANTGGVSTWDTPNAAWRGPTWRLPLGSQYPDELLPTNDAPGHWSWEPSRDMLLVEYVTALEAVNALFVKV